jgi:hypothetical protein
MKPFADDLAPSGTEDRPADAVSEVRRIQRELSLSRCMTPAAELLREPSWQQTAASLTRHFFPRYVRKDLDAVELIEQAYLHALYWYPLIAMHLPDNYGPGWDRGAVLAWLAAAIEGREERRWLGRTVLADRGRDGAAQAVTNACTVSMEDPRWVSQSVDVLWEISRSGGIKARIASLAYEALAYLDIDRVWLSPGQPSEPSADPERSAQRLRLGREVLVVADGTGPEKWPDLDWVDLCDTASDILDYRIRWSGPPGQPGSLEITVAPAVLAAARSRLTDVATGAGSPGYKLGVINDYLQDFERSHRSALGAAMQFASIQQHARSLLRQHLGRDSSDWKTALHVIQVGGDAPSRALNPFLHPEWPVAAWRAAFSPYR